MKQSKTNIPEILLDYLVRTEQHNLSNEQLLNEAKWLLWKCNNEEDYMEDREYTARQKNALIRFIDKTEKLVTIK